MKKIRLHMKLAFNEWYLTQIQLNSCKSLKNEDYKKPIKEQKKLISHLRDQINENRKAA